MAAFLLVLLALAVAFHFWAKARLEGTWTTARFLALVFGALALAAIVSLPVMLVSPSTLQAHEGLAIALMLVAITAGVVLLAVCANRWKKRL
ncbi:MAG TPA: hypothetical protein VLY23_15470 [Candidatus Acidoferrum sp.]|nr:hypothetical protein [Candidatus Acidoferrum sp.]